MLKLILADFKRTWAANLLLLTLIALATGFSVFVHLEERALRLGSARAAEAFDLLIGAMGSDTQLVLSTVYLQSAPLALLDRKHFDDVEKHPLTEWAAPVALGDSWFDSPLVGTTPTLLTRDGTRALAQGRMFANTQEAVIGARVKLKIGDQFVPLHGQAGQFDAHVHESVRYIVVGVLPPEDNAWSRAIFVPIEAVWETHHLGDAEHVRDEDDGDEHAPISAIVVKPKSIAGAYQLRDLYRQGQTLAVFPAEVLTKMYATLGDVRTILGKISLAAEALAILILIAGAVIHLRFHARQIAALRAFGACAHTIFILIWLELSLLSMLGMVFGVSFGFLGAFFVSHEISAQQGFPLPVVFEREDWKLLLFLPVASIALLLPASLGYRYSVARYMRDSGA
jgi:putative ABC transport system permease protein